MDPLNALVDLILGWRKTTTLFQWVALLFQIAASATVTFCFVCGTGLVTSGSWTIGIGSGLIMVAVIVAVFLRRSPLAKGMLFVFPAGEAEKEIHSDVQVLRRENK